MQRKIVIIANNLRSAHNVGSLLRTADGIGVERIYLTGYTPYPIAPQDKRLPHIAQRAEKLIAKTALGAEHTVRWHHEDSVADVITTLKQDGYAVCALEQAETAIEIAKYHVPKKIALILGNEVAGIDQQTLALVDTCLEIPMFGGKESYNVTQATAMALYHCRFMS